MKIPSAKFLDGTFQCTAQGTDRQRRRLPGTGPLAKPVHEVLWAQAAGLGYPLPQNELGQEAGIGHRNAPALALESDLFDLGSVCVPAVQP
jgi:hypothetical protein